MEANLHIERVPLDSIRPDPANVRLHSEPVRGLAGRPTKERPYRRRGVLVPCALCGERYYRRPSEAGRRYCSAACGNASRRRYPRETKACATCGKAFRYNERPFSNSSGHYCSHACRNQGYLGVVHGDASRPAKTDRQGWRSRRNRFFSSGNHFCIVCGKTSGRLHVHHIEGYRNTDPDDLSLLVTVCPRHHELLESWTKKIAGLPSEHRRPLAIVLAGHLWERQHVLIGTALKRKAGVA